MDFDITWIVAIISITGSLLNIRKKRACFILWLICEIFCFLIDMKNHQYGRAFLDMFCLGMNIYGFIKWSKEEESVENPKNKSRKTKSCKI